MYKLSIGRFDVYSIDDDASEGGVEFLAPNADPDERAAALARHGVTGDKVQISYNPVLIDTGRQKILIDAGWGQWLEKGDGGRYHGNLHDAITAADIQLVVLTHAHVDHYGGLVGENGELLFPKASYMMWKGEWDDWASDEAIKRLEAEQNPRAELVRHFLHPLQSKLTLLTEDNPEIAPGVTAIHAPGHTMGHMAVRVADGDDVLLIAADALLHPIHIKRLDWHFGNDVDHNAAQATRERLLSSACADNTWFHAYHFAYPGIGRITRTGDGYRFVAV
ncbi:MAG: MBL fold metallo-hydrolase [Chloroflexi bacterium]|nr:MBL fold metallo-hydrolase [Chloroflexota bacterium]